MRGAGGNVKQAVQSIDGEFIQRNLPLLGLAPPDPGTAHLWLINLAQLGSPLQPDEQIDPDNFPARQQRWLRRFYLRLLLGSYLDLPGKDVHIYRSKRGKPRLDRRHHDSTLDFSMAASSGRCLVGVTSGARIGVDLEPQGRRAGNPLSLARRYFSTREYEALKALAPSELDQAFLHSWACKEAVVKAAGQGIANALCLFTVDVRPDQPAKVLHMEQDDAAAWQLRCLSLPEGFIGAVTVRYPTLQIQSYQLTPRA